MNRSFGDALEHLFEGIGTSMCLLEPREPGDPFTLEVSSINAAASRLFACDRNSDDWQTEVFRILTDSGVIRRAVAVSTAHEQSAARAADQADGVAMTSASGQGHVVDIELVPLPNNAAAGRCCPVALIMNDITESQATVEELNYRADHDALTGLPNRRAFYSALSEALAAGDGVALILADLDRFKEVNDTLGHHAGDQLLIGFSERLRDGVPEHWHVGRLGGDEFGLFATVSTHEAVETGQRLRREVGEPLIISGLEMCIQASFGIATAPTDGNDVATLMRRADSALYAAKSNGRGVARANTDPSEKLWSQLSASGRLQQAFENGEFSVYLQPIHDAVERTLVGSEALARWVVPGHGVLTPGAFLNIVKMAGSMDQLSDQIMAQAASCIDDEHFVTINLSDRDLYRPDLAGRLQTLADDMHFDLGRLWIEVVERQLGDGVVDAIVELRRIGVRFALADYGSGHSSIERVASLPFDMLKFDRSVVTSVLSNARSRTLVRAITEAARSLGMDVLGEGIETERGAQVMGDLGCTMLQGFHIGRPEAMDGMHNADAPLLEATPAAS